MCCVEKPTSQHRRPRPSVSAPPISNPIEGHTSNRTETFQIPSGNHADCHRMADFRFFESGFLFDMLGGRCFTSPVAL
ncbi:hypothetical protein AAMO2058_001675200 [Amorphochlora amoebiformis]